MGEIWKDIEGYEGMYQVSNYGRVRSLNYNHTKQIIILKNRIDKDGYARICLNYKKNKSISSIHRLVAKAFIQNPDNLPCINHKDEDKTNNFVYINEDGTVNLEKSNLEWCTVKYNNVYGTRLKRVADSLKGRLFSEETRKKMSIAKKGKNNTNKSKPVIQIDKESGEILNEYPSINEIHRQLGYTLSHISNCCTGKIEEAYGYVWSFSSAS